MRDGHVWSAPVDVARQAQHRVAVLEEPLRRGVEHLPDSASRSIAAGPASTGRATHSPIIGTWPARKIGQEASSRRARLAATGAGSPSVPER